MPNVVCRYAFFTAVMAAIAFGSRVSAQSTYLWNSNNTTAQWYAPTNWTGGPLGTYPGTSTAAGAGNAGDIAQFNPTVTTQIGIDMSAGTPLSLGAINFQSTASLTIGNSAASTAGILRLNGATVNSVANTLIAVGNTGADLTIANTAAGGGSTMQLQLGTTNGVFNIYGDATPNTGIRNLTISTVISEAVAGSGFTVQGGGNLILSGANTFTGDVTIANGRVQISTATALGTTAGKTIVQSGGTLFVNAAMTLAENIDFAGTGFTEASKLFGAIRLNGATIFTGTLTLTGNSQIYTQAGTSQIGNGTIGTLTESGGARNLDILGGNTLQINSPTTYTGATTVQQSALNLSGAGTTTGSLLTSGIEVSLTGTLQLTNTTAALSNANRLPDAAPITLRSGTFNFNNNATAGVNYSETAGPLTVSQNLNTVTASQAAAAQTSAVTFASLTRAAGGGVNFTGTGLGADARNQVLFTAAPTLVGGATQAAGGIIGPWAYYNVTAGALTPTAATADFASYGPNGVVAMGNLATSPTGADWAAATNVKLTFTDASTTALAAPVAQINSLTVIQNTTGTTAVTNTLDLSGTGGGPGSLRIGSGGVLVTGPHNLTINSAATALTAGLTAGTPAEFVFNVFAGTTTVNAVLADNGVGGTTGLTKLGNGTLVLAGANTFTGPITIAGSNNGSGITVTNAAGLGGTTSITLRAGTGAGNGTQLSLNTAMTVTGVTLNMESFLLGGVVSNITVQGPTGVNARTTLVSNSNVTWAGPIVLTGNNFVTVSETVVNTPINLNGPISESAPGAFTGVVFLRGNGNINVNGLITLPTGTIASTDANTVVTINAPPSGTNQLLGVEATFGQIRLGASNVIPAASTVILGQNGNANVAQFWLNGNNQTIAQLGVAAGSTGVLGSMIVQNGGLTPSTLTFNGNATPSTFTGVVADGIGGGLLNLTMTGGSLTLANAASTYTGVTQVNGGTLTVAAMANGGSPSSIGSSPSAATSLVLNGGTLVYTGGSAVTDRGFTVAAGNGTLNLPSVGTTLTFGGSSVFTGGLIKTGPGRLTLTGASSGAGTVAVNAGSLAVNNTSGAATGTGVTTVAAGATVTGIGRLGGGLFVSGGGTLSPGNPGIGTLSADPGITTWAPGGIYTVDYDSTAGLPFTPGTTIDLYNSSGTLNVSATSGNPFVINLHRVAGTGPQTSTTVTIASFASPPTLAANQFTFTGSFFSGVTPAVSVNGNDVQITFAPAGLPPAALTWQATTSNTWSNPANWDAGTIPQPGTVVTFSAAGATQFTTTNDISNLTVDGVRVTGTAPSAFVINGNPITIATATGFDLSAAAQSLTVNTAVTMGVSQNWTVAANRTLQVTGPVDGASALTVNGAGTVQVSNAANSFTGGTTITAGVLEVTQSAAANLTIPATGNSQLGTGAITINGGELRLTALSPATTSVTGTQRTVTFGVNGGILSMNKTVAGVFPIVTNNTATGTAIIRSTIANMDVWANGNALQINNGNLTGTGPVRYEFSGGAAAVFNAQTVPIPMALTLQGADNGSAAANRAGVAVSGAIANTTLGRFGTVNTTTMTTFANGLFFRNALQFTEFGGAATIDADITIQTMPNGTFASFQGRGTAGPNTFSSLTLGNATVNSRTITIQNNATMILDSRFRTDLADTGGVTLNAQTVIQSGGTLEFNQTFTTSTGENATGFHLVNGSITGTGSDVADARLNLQLADKVATGGANGGVNWNSIVTTPTPAALIVNGTGNGGLRVEGLSANIFDSTAGNNGGFYSPARINGLTGTGGALTFAPSTAGLVLNLAPSAPSAVKLGVGSSAATSVAVTLGSTAGDLANWGGLVVKGSSGAGTTVATVAVNQTFASTTVLGGTLLVGTGVTLTSPVALTGGTLGGFGNVAGNVTVASGAAIAPGASPGVLTVTGNVTFSSGSTFRPELNGNTPGNAANNHDQLVLSGTGSQLTLGNATLTATLGYTPSNADKLFVIVQTDPAAISAGTPGTNPTTFNGIAQNGNVTIGGFTAQVSYVGDSGSAAITGGNDVVLYNFIPVPEPATVLGFAAAGLAGAGWLRRRYTRA